MNNQNRKSLTTLQLIPECVRHFKYDASDLPIFRTVKVIKPDRSDIRFFEVILSSGFGLN